MGNAGLLQSLQAYRNVRFWLCHEAQSTYYPNNSAPALGLLNNYNNLMANNGGATLWDHSEVTNPNSGNRYVYHPARGNYAPILLGLVSVFSTSIVSGELTLNIEPIIYLWNPYNITLSVPKFGIEMEKGHGGKVTIEVIKREFSGGVEISSETKHYGPANENLLKEKRIEAGVNPESDEELTYIVSDLTMSPGEVVIVTPQREMPPLMIFMMRRLPS